jgi:protein-glutamine gamma-glutamyltransferase
MPLQRLLQIVVASLAAMGTMLLGMGQRDIGMTLLMILAAGLSVWLTDVKGWLYLNRNLANLIMLAAALFSLRDLFHIYSEAQALTFAQFLIYLQIILLFQKKDSRTYWLLIMLSLLQVVVAALFSQGVFFGILLVGYMLLASLALTLLLLSRQYEPTRPNATFCLITFGRYREGEAPAEPRQAQESTGTLPARQEPRPADRPAPSRWPLADRQAEFADAPAASSRQGVGGELYRRLWGMSARTMGLTMVLFIIVPRFGQVGWKGGIAQPKATVGFNDEVNLGEMGEIIESPSEVMRVHFTEGKGSSEKPYRTSGEIYLYGGLLTEYNSGRWSPGIPSEGAQAADPPWQVLPGAKWPASYVTQHCDLEPLDRNELFYVAPVFPVDDNDYIRPERKLCRWTRDPALRTRIFSYRMGTTAFRNGFQLPLTPRDELERLLFAKQIPKDKNGEPALKQLKALAERWDAESKLPKDKVVERARYLESKLASTGEYKYSLQPQNRNIDAMDPIEDFLIEHKAGHCEYFATALTLMLRHVDIPARMVVGFKCDEWHEAEQCYQVRQLHAHTWVQAYLEYEQLPKDAVHGENYWQWKKNKGGWLRLDPTPARDEQAKNGFFAPIEKGLQWLDFTWSYYVVELNYDRQRRAIFMPIFNAAMRLFNFLRDPNTWHGFYERIGEALHRSGAAGALAWVLLVLTIAASVALIGLVGYLFWRLVRKLWLRLAARRKRRRRGPRIEVEFYRRLEHLLKKNGLSRPVGQTAREFAAVAGEWIAAKTGQERLLPFPARIVEAYYRVRFGRLPLDGEQTRDVDQVLREMESRMADRRRGRG